MSDALEEIHQLKWMVSTLQARVDAIGSKIAEMDDDIPEQAATVASEEGEAFEILGTPALFKVVELLGWTLDSNGDWTQMTIAAMVAYPPTDLWAGETAAGNYLRPTWDYPRTH